MKNIQMFLSLSQIFWYGLIHAQNVPIERVMTAQEQFIYLVQNSRYDLDSVMCSGWSPLGCGGWQIRDLFPAFGVPSCLWGPYTQSEVQEAWNRVRDPDCLVVGLVEYTEVPEWIPHNFSERYRLIAQVARQRVFKERPILTVRYTNVTVRISYPEYLISIARGEVFILANTLSEMEIESIVHTIVEKYPQQIELAVPEVLSRLGIGK